MKTSSKWLSLALSAGVIFASGCGKQDTGGRDAPASQPAANNLESPPSGGTTSAEGPTAASGRAIEVTGNDAMKFSVTEMKAAPGESLTVTLVNIGTMPKFSMGHNWVLLKKGADVDAFVNDSAQAPTTDYIPQARRGDILAFTKLLGPKERDSVTFQAPKEPGEYVFLCSFPGHYQVGMRGVLIVE